MKSFEQIMDQAIESATTDAGGILPADEAHRLKLMFLHGAAAVFSATPITTQDDIAVMGKALIASSHKE